MTHSRTLLFAVTMSVSLIGVVACEKREARVGSSRSSARAPAPADGSAPGSADAGAQRFAPDCLATGQPAPSIRPKRRGHRRARLHLVEPATVELTLVREAPRKLDVDAFTSLWPCLFGATPTVPGPLFDGVSLGAPVEPKTLEQAAAIVGWLEQHGAVGRIWGEVGRVFEIYVGFVGSDHDTVRALLEQVYGAPSREVDDDDADGKDWVEWGDGASGSLKLRLSSTWAGTGLTWAIVLGPRAWVRPEVGGIEEFGFGPVPRLGERVLDLQERLVAGGGLGISAPYVDEWWDAGVEAGSSTFVRVRRDQGVVAEWCTRLSDTPDNVGVVLEHISNKKWAEHHRAAGWPSNRTWDFPDDVHVTATAVVDEVSFFFYRGDASARALTSCE